MEPDPATIPELMRAGARRSPRLLFAAAIVAVALVVSTVARFGLTANGVGWALAQIVLVFIAWFDVLERRIPNVVVVPATVAALVLRLAFERAVLLECVIACVAAFAVFLVFALLVRGGLGMGDVKLAAMIGALLGSASLYALMLGVIAGGLGAAIILLARRGTRRTTYAYGPFLALGASVLILVGDVPRLV